MANKHKHKKPLPIVLTVGELKNIILDTGCPDLPVVGITLLATALHKRMALTPRTRLGVDTIRGTLLDTAYARLTPGLINDIARRVRGRLVTTWPDETPQRHEGVRANNGPRRKNQEDFTWPDRRLGHGRRNGLGAHRRGVPTDRNHMEAAAARVAQDVAKQLKLHFKTNPPHQTINVTVGLDDGVFED